MKFFNFISIILSLFFANVSYGEATYCIFIESHFFEDSVDKPDFKENTDFISVNENPIFFNNETFDSRLMDGLAKGCFSEKILKDGLNEFNFGIQSRIVINYVHQRFKVYMEGPGRGRFDLFNITAKGNAGEKASYSGSTTLQLSFASLNPQLDYAQRGLITDVDINRSKIDITNRDIESARKILSELLNKKFEDIVPEDFARFDKTMLVQLLSDLRKDKAQLNADIDSKIQKIRQDVLDLSNYAQSELEKSSGSEGDINRALETIDLPDLELPALDDEIPPFDEATSQYAQYATEVFQKLEAARASNNRQYFLELVWVWAREQASLDLLLSARPGVLPAEYASFMAAQKRVYDYVYTVVDHRFYFLDVPVPEDLKDGIEQEMNEFSPQLAKSLKATLNESGSRLNSEDSATIIEMFRAIRLFYKIAREEEDQKVKKALVQEADEKTQELISILRMGLTFTPADPIFGFCEMITGKEGCLARGRDLSEVEMAIACAPFFLKGLGKVVAMGSKRFGGYFKIERVAEKGEKVFEAGQIKLGSGDGLNNFLDIVKTDVKSAGERLAETIKDMKYPQLWTDTKKKSAVENAYRHYKDHVTEFLGLNNAVEYVEQAHTFMKSPPTGTLTKVRANGDEIFFHEVTNTFAICNADQAPRTMFKPDPTKHGYSTNLEYFNAQ